MTELTTEQVIAFGEHAQQLLDDETFRTVVQEIESQTIGHWRAAQEPLERERAWAICKALDLLLNELRVHVDRAKVAVDERDRTRPRIVV